jgi:hypothetical protein
MVGENWHQGLPKSQSVHEAYLMHALTGQEKRREID